MQEYIDNEHAETTYDPKYQGAYDDRPLEPGDLSELNGIIADSPWTEERMEKVFDKLFDGCQEHAEAHSELHKEMQSLNDQRRRQTVAARSRSMIEETEEETRRELGVVQVVRPPRVPAARADGRCRWTRSGRSELIERYRFQLTVQRLYQESRDNFNKADAYIGAYVAAIASRSSCPTTSPRRSSRCCGSRGRR